MATAGTVPSCTFGLTGGMVTRRVERLLAEDTHAGRVLLGAGAAVVALLVLPFALVLAV